MKCDSGQHILWAGSEHLWDNLHETNMATDEICVPYCHLLPDLTTDFMQVTPRHVVMIPFLLKGYWQSLCPIETAPDVYENT